jgi:hypothetical protein
VGLTVLKTATVQFSSVQLHQTCSVWNEGLKLEALGQLPKTPSRNRSPQRGRKRRTSANEEDEEEDKEKNK